MRVEISEYFSENGKKTAKVFTDGREYVVVSVNELGTSFKSVWDSREKAEDYAEEWVLKNE